MSETRVYARAPGKVMIAGEYAVLDGCTSLVMAVDRYATAVASREALDPAQGWETPELTETLALAGWDRVPSVRVKPGTLFEGTRKLGLGSSAAMCVAGLAAATACVEGGSALDRESLARLSRRGHRAAQGGGSGVDVLASALGGVLAVTLGTDPDEVQTEALAWPAGVHWRVLWTGEPVSTKHFVARVRALGSDDPAGYREALGAVRSAAEGALGAMRTGDSAGLIEALGEHGRAMKHLGRRAGIAIVTDAMRTLAERGRALGVAVKPSGAGGGDIVLAVSESVSALDALGEQARALGVVPVAMGLDAHGARVISADEAAESLAD
ncbi:MAG: hypothetical protein Q8Q09_10180 [Deltaproteobacteria bacterium]|nr:hypothetical protein [Deltaproteobacteria bacterium]